MTVKCAQCPLRKFELFKGMSETDVAFTQKFKTGELVAEPGTEILSENASAPQLYTALSGMGVRYRLLPDGNRQVVGFVLPGDFIGLQSGVMGVMRHTVEVTETMRLCVFNRSDLWSLFKTHPNRAFDLTHLAAQEERILGEALTAVGQLDARGKLAWLLHRLYMRLRGVGLDENGRVPLPYRQQDLAEALGLSLVHTNKTLAALRETGVATWADKWLTVHDVPKLAQLAQVSADDLPARPLI